MASPAESHRDPGTSRHKAQRRRDGDLPEHHPDPVHLTASHARHLRCLLTALPWALHALSPVILIDHERSRVARAQIPVDLLTNPTALSIDEMKKIRGPGADARVLVCTRDGYPKESACESTALLTPPPFWLFSTRQPAQALHLLTSAPRRPSTAGHERR